jgi:hypothetical protein
MAIIILKAPSEIDRQAVLYNLRRAGCLPSIPLREPWTEHNVLLLNYDEGTYAVLPAGRYELRPSVDLRVFNLPEQYPALLTDFEFGDDPWVNAPTIDLQLEQSLDQLMEVNKHFKQLAQQVSGIPAAYLGHADLTYWWNQLMQGIRSLEADYNARSGANDLPF